MAVQIRRLRSESGLAVEISRNRAKNRPATTSWSALGVPAPIIFRRSKARLQAAACTSIHTMDIKQVAKRAGVSTATVSRTINNLPVRPGTARRVRQAIEELKYFPNTHARSLVSGRSRIVGLIVSDITNPFFPELVKGFEDAATQKGYEVLLSNTEYDSSRMATGVRRMLERKVDAVAIMTSEMDRSFTQELAGRDIPMVFLDVGTVEKHISNIKVDYASGISQAVEHLI